MHRLTSLLADGVALRSDVARAAGSSSISRWLERGQLVLAHPGVLVLPDRSGEWAVRARAATLWTQGPLSHLSALTAWGLAEQRPGPVHVTVSADRWPRGDPGVMVHRTTLPMRQLLAGELPALGPSRSLVDAWSWAHSPRREPGAAQQVPVVRRAVLEGVRSHGLRVAALAEESARRPRHAGRRELAELLALVDGGCQRELEVWGVRHVLGIAGVSAPVQQHVVRLPSGSTAVLDAAYLEAQVAVEMDGHAHHSTRAAREHDMRRDTALAVLGWVVLRFSYDRLTRDPGGCRREIAAVIRRRTAERSPP